VGYLLALTFGNGFPQQTLNYVNDPVTTGQCSFVELGWEGHLRSLEMNSRFRAVTLCPWMNVSYA
jgi:hypothetical protein